MVTDGRTIHPTDHPSIRRTDTPSYRDGCAHLKTMSMPSHKPDPYSNKSVFTIQSCCLGSMQLQSCLHEIVHNAIRRKETVFSSVGLRCLCQMTKIYYFLSSFLLKIKFKLNYYAWNLRLPLAIHWQYKCVFLMYE